MPWRDMAYDAGARGDDIARMAQQIELEEQEREQNRLAERAAAARDEDESAMPCHDDAP